jgi:glycosyltransferase involved in cell wall biosynthesis
MRRSIHLISPDIVHTHTHVGAVWGRAAAVLARVPRIAHTEHRSVDRLPPLERAAIALLNSRTDVIVTFSERAAKLVRERERIRDLHVIPNGIRVRPLPSETDRRIARRKLDLDEKVVAVGMIANLYPHKNPFLGIDAIARLPAQSRGAIRLALFGDGPLRHALSARADELGVQALVRFYGFRTDIEQLLPGMDLILTTSPREMMPISLLESMNAALPIIGAPHAGTLDLVVDGETGLVLKSWDPGLFGEALEWAITHPEWRARAGSAAHLRLKKYFDIETVADRYVDLYQRMLHRNSG